METRILGCTGLEVSVMGLGAGGPSRLGQRDEVKSEAESVSLVLQALDAGINFIDTAEAYRTEDIVGKAVAQRDRASVIISTKKRLGGSAITRAELRAGLEDSLRRLRTDYVDIYHLHGLRPEDYDYYLNEIAPFMQDLQARGMIRFLGVTESWSRDLGHDMLQRALQDDIWDVIMVGFNLLNQTARETVLAQASEKQIGVLIMFAVRLALSRPDRLRRALESLIETGELDAREIDLDRPLGFLGEDGLDPDTTDAAYRFCRDEPGVHVVLSGTSNPQHLAANLASFARPPLPPQHTARLQRIFRNVVSATGG
ncbi:MAG: aldo/keto reductase [Chloroflexota bacterium]|nr:aldo/keto reductase [Chloroflexota bacterium]